MQQLPGDMHLVGGQLPTGLRAIGVTRDQVTDVVCTHLHADHVGWLFDRHADPVFPEATIWFGAADRHHFVDGPGEMAGHIKAGSRRRLHTSRLRPIDVDTTVTRGVEILLTPGHTPGHLCVTVESGMERVLLLGAITCPVQLSPSFSQDVSPHVVCGGGARFNTVEPVLAGSQDGPAAGPRPAPLSRWSGWCAAS